LNGSKPVFDIWHTMTGDRINVIDVFRFEIAR
jgi:hypothetical protein